MAHQRIGLGKHPLLDDTSRPNLSSQPDLSVGRQLKHAIRALNWTATHRRSAYASAWIDEVEDIGVTVEARCERDGNWALSVGILDNPQLQERMQRVSELTEHMHSIEGSRAEIIDLSRRRGKYLDYRDVDTRTVISIVRDFVDSGGYLFVSPGGCPAFREDAKLLSSPRPDEAERAHAHFIALREAAGLARRFRSHKRLARIGRLLGTRTDNGWHVYERKAAAGSADTVIA